MTVHPATELWWAQRDKCRSCTHHFTFTLRRRYGDEVGGERCRACPAERGKRAFLYCIDARLADSPCGPAAKLFSPIAIHETKKESE
jgi:hypothetical protein